MQKYTWTEAYSVGVEEIDKQHQHFFELANEIVDLADKKDISKSDLLFKITGLNNYAVYHLATEEDLFKKFNYTDATAHIAVHNVYKEEMKKFIAEIEKEGVDAKDLATKIAGFSGAWLASHIMNMDKKYENYMHENGIK